MGPGPKLRSSTNSAVGPPQVLEVQGMNSLITTRPCENAEKLTRKWVSSMIRIIFTGKVCLDFKIGYCTGKVQQQNEILKDITLNFSGLMVSP
jgi:hypothetical protein